MNKSNGFTKFLKFGVVVLLIAVVLLPASARAAPNAYGNYCSCLEYFQNNSGLPATGIENFPAYKYANWLATNTSYPVNYVKPSENPGWQLDEVGMIIGPNVLGAELAGHIAIVDGVNYNPSTQEWQIDFEDTYSNYPFMPGFDSTFHDPSTGCNDVGLREIYTPNLDGITFFTWY